MKNVFIIAAVLAVVTSAASGAAEWPNIPANPSGEATVWDPDPQWPQLRANAAENGASQRRAWDMEPRWPARTGAPETTGSIPRAAAWPATAVVAALSPFAFEIGARYWYSDASAKFGFTNGHPLFGRPTSTLDWEGAHGNAGEIFGRIDHRPTGIFVKGLVGAGKLNGGTIIDRDFLVYQIKFSDTSSDIKGDSFRFGIVDVGWGFEVPGAGVRLGAFVGYHYWNEKMTAYGVVCNPDDIRGLLCGAPGTVLAASNTAVLGYEPTWHALRVGFDARFQITPDWSLSGEIAAIPYAVLENKDSHLLRQDMSDLGPAPNVVSRSNQGWGGEAELFVNYAVHPNLAIGLGARYWGLMTNRGGVQFGPDFVADYALTRFDQQRYGVLVQVKGRI